MNSKIFVVEFRGTPMKFFTDKLDAHDWAEATFYEEDVPHLELVSYTRT